MGGFFDADRQADHNRPPDRGGGGHHASNGFVQQSNQNSSPRRSTSSSEHNHKHQRGHHQSERGGGNMNVGEGNGSGHPPGYTSPVAETLFRKDLISAMKIHDSEPLDASTDFWGVSDTWKQEWEQGVQVPVKSVHNMTKPRVSWAKDPPQISNRFTFGKKLISMSGEYTKSCESTHQATPMALRAEQVVDYDLDDVDTTWLDTINKHRLLAGYPTITPLEMESVIEEFEIQTAVKMESVISNEICPQNMTPSTSSETSSNTTGLTSSPSEESVICDVCRSPDSEEDNEMVYCDKCNICVHQACYGITSIPSGPWLCKTCSLNIHPSCELCPNRGGAMKATKSGTKWAHVGCALWIPEVSIKCVEKMEPITKISTIPASRWSLVCVICKEKRGACIQCCVKTCKTAYHVTCAFKRGLEMRAIIDEDNSQDSGVNLRSYCEKHSSNLSLPVANRKRNTTISTSSSQLSNHQKVLKIESEFFTYVNLCSVRYKFPHLACASNNSSSTLKTSTPPSFNFIDVLFRYWILKRKSQPNHRCNKPLIRNLRLDERPSLRRMIAENQSTSNSTSKRAAESAEHIESDSLISGNVANHNGSDIHSTGNSSSSTMKHVDDVNSKMRKFVSVRQDLERVRNLCYMVSRREKLLKSYVRLREQVFVKQVDVLVESRKEPTSLSSLEMQAILEANHSEAIYDRIFSSKTPVSGDDEDQKPPPLSSKSLSDQFESLISRIAGTASSTSSTPTSTQYSSNSSKSPPQSNKNKSSVVSLVSSVNNNNKGSVRRRYSTFFSASSEDSDGGGGISLEPSRNRSVISDDQEEHINENNKHLSDSSSVTVTTHRKKVISSKKTKIKSAKVISVSSPSRGRSKKVSSKQPSPPPPSQASHSVNTKRDTCFGSLFDQVQKSVNFRDANEAPLQSPPHAPAPIMSKMTPKIKQSLRSPSPIRDMKSSANSQNLNSSGFNVSNTSSTLFSDELPSMSSSTSENDDDHDEFTLSSVSKSKKGSSSLSKGGASIKKVEMVKSKPSKSSSSKTKQKIMFGEDNHIDDGNSDRLVPAPQQQQLFRTKAAVKDFSIEEQLLINKKGSSGTSVSKHQPKLPVSSSRRKESVSSTSSSATSNALPLSSSVNKKGQEVPKKRRGTNGAGASSTTSSSSSSSSSSSGSSDSSGTSGSSDSSSASSSSGSSSSGSSSSSSSSSSSESSSEMKLNGDDVKAKKKDKKKQPVPKGKKKNVVTVSNDVIVVSGQTSQVGQQLLVSEEEEEVDESGSAFYPMIVPQRAAARKASVKLKEPPGGSANNSTLITNTSVPVTDNLVSAETGVQKSSSSPPKVASIPRMFSPSDRSVKSKSPLKSPTGSQSTGVINVDTASVRGCRYKNDVDASSPAGSSGSSSLSYLVPQRKAAKRATANLKDADRSIMKNESALFETAPSSPPHRTTSVGSSAIPPSLLPPLHERLHLSSDSDSDTPPYINVVPVSKAKHPRSKASSSNKSHTTKKSSSSNPMSASLSDFLSQRESQLDKVFQECGLTSSITSPKSTTLSAHGDVKNATDAVVSDDACASAGVIVSKKLKTSENNDPVKVDNEKQETKSSADESVLGSSIDPSSNNDQISVKSLETLSSQPNEISQSTPLNLSAGSSSGSSSSSSSSGSSDDESGSGESSTGSGKSVKTGVRRRSRKSGSNTSSSSSGDESSSSSSDDDAAEHFADGRNVLSKKKKKKVRRKKRKDRRKLASKDATEDGKTFTAINGGKFGTLTADQSGATEININVPDSTVKETVRQGSPIKSLVGVDQQQTAVEALCGDSGEKISAVAATNYVNDDDSTFQDANIIDSQPPSPCSEAHNEQGSQDQQTGSVVVVGKPETMEVEEEGAERQGEQLPPSGVNDSVDTTASTMHHQTSTTSTSNFDDHHVERSSDEIKLTPHVEVVSSSNSERVDVVDDCGQATPLSSSSNLFPTPTHAPSSVPSSLEQQQPPSSTHHPSTNNTVAPQEQAVSSYFNSTPSADQPQQPWTSDGNNQYNGQNQGHQTYYGVTDKQSVGAVAIPQGQSSTAAGGQVGGSSVFGNNSNSSMLMNGMLNKDQLTNQADKNVDVENRKARQANEAFFNYVYDMQRALSQQGVQLPTVAEVESFQAQLNNVDHQQNRQMSKSSTAPQGQGYAVGQQAVSELDQALSQSAAAYAAVDRLRQQKEQYKTPNVKHTQDHYNQNVGSQSVQQQQYYPQQNQQNVQRERSVQGNVGVGSNNQPPSQSSNTSSEAFMREYEAVAQAVASQQQQPVAASQHHQQQTQQSQSSGLHATAWHQMSVEDQLKQFYAQAAQQQRTAVASSPQKDAVSVTAQLQKTQHQQQRSSVSQNLNGNGASHQRGTINGNQSNRSSTSHTSLTAETANSTDSVTVQAAATAYAAAMQAATQQHYEQLLGLGGGGSVSGVGNITSGRNAAGGNTGGTATYNNGAISQSNKRVTAQQTSSQQQAAYMQQMMLMQQQMEQHAQRNNSSSSSQMAAQSAATKELQALEHLFQQQAASYAAQQQHQVSSQHHTATNPLTLLEQEYLKLQQQQMSAVMSHAVTAASSTNNVNSSGNKQAMELAAPRQRPKGPATVNSSAYLSAAQQQQQQAQAQWEQEMMNQLKKSAAEAASMASSGHRGLHGERLQSGCAVVEKPGSSRYDQPHQQQSGNAHSQSNLPMMSNSNVQQYQHRPNVEQQQSHQPPYSRQEAVNHHTKPLSISVDNNNVRGGGQPGLLSSASSTSSKSTIPGMGSSTATTTSDELSKDLLDSIAAVSAIPVWKPESERSNEDGEGGPCSSHRSTSSVNENNVVQRGHTYIGGGDVAFPPERQRHAEMDPPLHHMEPIHEQHYRQNGDENGNRNNFRRVLAPPTPVSAAFVPPMSERVCDDLGGVDYHDDYEQFQDHGSSVAGGGSASVDRVFRPKLPESYKDIAVGDNAAPDDFDKAFNSSSENKRASTTVLSSKVNQDTLTQNPNVLVKSNVEIKSVSLKNTDSNTLSTINNNKFTSNKLHVNQNHGVTVASVAALPLTKSKYRPLARTLDVKGLEKVHEKVAGTDYDFEEEFQDEDLTSKKTGKGGVKGGKKLVHAPLSLQELREQTKKQNAMLDEHNVKSTNGPTTTPIKKEGVNKAPKTNMKASPQKKKVAKLKIADLKQRLVTSDQNSGGVAPISLKNLMSSAAELKSLSVDVNDSISEKVYSLPKLPKLKLGSLIAAAASSSSASVPTPPPPTSSDPPSKMVPKLKIKLGPKPPSALQTTVNHVGANGGTLVNNVNGSEPSKHNSVKSSSSPDVEDLDSIFGPNRSSLSIASGLTNGIDNDTDKQSSPVKKMVDANTDGINSNTGENSSFKKENVPFSTEAVSGKGVVVVSEKSEIELIQEEINKQIAAEESSSVVNKLKNSPHHHSIKRPKNIDLSVNSSVETNEKKTNHSTNNVPSSPRIPTVVTSLPSCVNEDPRKKALSALHLNKMSTESMSCVSEHQSFIGFVAKKSPATSQQLQQKNRSPRPPILTSSNHLSASPTSTENRNHHLKMKFKVHHHPVAKTPTPNASPAGSEPYTASAAIVSALPHPSEGGQATSYEGSAVLPESSNGVSASLESNVTFQPPAAAQPSVMGHRMRKKELLSQYYEDTTTTTTSLNTTNSNSSLLPSNTASFSSNDKSTLNALHSTTAVYNNNSDYQTDVGSNQQKLQQEDPYSMFPSYYPQQMPAIRSVIKMPKAVASVTSVPTRADYQGQLEANLERKRKRDAAAAAIAMGLPVPADTPAAVALKGGSTAVGRKKRGGGAVGGGTTKSGAASGRGRGGGGTSSNNADRDYIPKSKQFARPSSSAASTSIMSSATSTTQKLDDKGIANGDDTSNHLVNGDVGEKRNANQRKTRCKPPKKCLIENEGSEDDGDMKAENMKFAEKIRASFDQPPVGGHTAPGSRKRKKPPASIISTSSGTVEEFGVQQTRNGPDCSLNINATKTDVNDNHYIVRDEDAAKKFHQDLEFNNEKIGNEKVPSNESFNTSSVTPFDPNKTEAIVKIPKLKIKMQKV